MPSEAVITVAVVRRDAVGGEDDIVRSRLAGQSIDQLGTNVGRQLLTGDDRRHGSGRSRRVGGGEVHQLVGQFVVVLQGMDEGDRLQVLPAGRCSG